MPHCVLLLRIRCCATAAVDSDTENESGREAVELGLSLHYSFSPGSKTLITH